MKKEIKVPPLGESIVEATIGRIFKAEGSFVEENEELLELETEKVNQALFAPASGIVSWRVKEGDSVQVDAVIGEVEEGGSPKKASTKKEEPKKEVVKERKEEAAPVSSTSRSGKKESRKKMSKIRKVIASRLVDSLHNAAMLTTFNEVDMTRVMEARATHKEGFLQKHQVKLGLTSFFVKATLEALKAYPQLNSYIDGDDIVQREYFDIGVAISSDRGLVVPVIRDVEKLSYADIEKAVEAYAKKAREGGLKIEDLEGGGFTITNGGIFGSLLSTPILNPPQVGILGLHKIEKRPVVINDQIVIRNMMYLALSYDHRIIDGKEAIGFLVKVKEVLENLVFNAP